MIGKHPVTEVCPKLEADIAQYPLDRVVARLLFNLDEAITKS